MRKNADLRPRQSGAVNQRGVTELVQNDQVPGARKSAQNPDIRLVTGRENQRAFTAFELSDFLFKARVAGRRPGNQSRRSRAGPLPRGLLKSTDYPGMA